MFFRVLKKRMWHASKRIPFEETSLRVLPGGVHDEIQNRVSSYDEALIKIQNYERNKQRDARESLKDDLKAEAYSRYRRNREDRFITQLWRNLNPETEFTANWFERASNVLTKKDFATENFWWKVMEDILTALMEMTEEGNPINYLDDPRSYQKTLKATVNLLKKVGYSTTFDTFAARDALQWWEGLHKDRKARRRE